jgi:hypothetical protein
MRAEPKMNLEMLPTQSRDDTSFHAVGINPLNDTFEHAAIKKSHRGNAYCGSGNAE